MRRIRLSVVIVFCMFLVAANAVAQMPTPTPPPELSKLAFLAGNWTTEGEMKPSSMGPGGKMSSDDEIHWMDGKFYLVMHSKFKGALGTGTSLAVFGYDPERKAYTYNDFSMGQNGSSLGTVDGNTWTWLSDEKMGGQTFKGRFTMVVQSPTAYTYKYEMSPDGTDWKVAMDGKSTKK
jgi:hypothetical protein